MLAMMLILISGVLVGFLWREKHRFLVGADRMMICSVFFLVFFLGMSVGNNHQVVNDFLVFGMRSLILCSGAIAGSVALSFFLYQAVFKRIVR